MKIVFLKSFLNDIQKIKDPETALKVELLILELKSATSLRDVKNVKKMQGYAGAYRIRIGDYRMGIYKEFDSVELARFVKRNDIYKVFP